MDGVGDRVDGVGDRGWVVWVIDKQGVDGVRGRGWVVWVTDKRGGWCRRQTVGGCCG